MPRGGARPGSGRKPGSPNKMTAQKQAEIAASGMTPLDYMLSVMRDEKADEAKRLDAAKGAAPYVHPRLSQIDAKVKGEFDVRAWMTSAQSAAEEEGEAQ